jgi:hypothetical protein
MRIWEATSPLRMAATSASEDRNSCSLPGVSSMRYIVDPVLTVVVG